MKTRKIHYIGKPEETFTIRSTEDKVTFYDFDTNRAYTRTKWVDSIGLEYVRFNSAFQALSIQKLHEGLKITVGEYR